MFESITSSGTSYISSGTTIAGDSLWVTNNPCQEINLNSTTPYLTNTSIFNTNMNKVQVHRVAVFKVERNDKNEITSAKFIKEMWIETKNGSSIDFEVAKDSEISKYKSDEISIRAIYTVTF